jgi:hypothetical protein
VEDVRADRVFLKDLKRLDERLGCKFNGSHFVITYDRGYGKPVNIQLIRDDAGGFRQPNRYDIEFVAGGDLAREPMKHRLQRISRYMEDFEASERKKRREVIRDMTKDGKHQLKKAFDLANEGVIPKRRGMPL